jgi:(2S)-methylsuccinyl-CoA dehydrogenase
MPVTDSDDLLLASAQAALGFAREYWERARSSAYEAVTHDGVIDAGLFQSAQRRMHALAWIATAIEGLAQLERWCARLARENSLSAGDRLVLSIGFGEYLGQILGGLPMSQNELIRPSDLRAEEAAALLRGQAPIEYFLSEGNTVSSRAQLAALLAGGWRPNERFGDEELDMMREQVRRFTDDEILPRAQAWHLADALIPDEVISQMAALGIFGLCIAAEHGGSGLGKLAMCVVSEELSRGWIAAGSLGTRSEIAAELIATSGTPAQKNRWLPGIASGDVLPTAVFTEPGAGSDLASLTTRAIPDGEGGWRITGAKCWITHAARSDLMTLLARTGAEAGKHDGLSMFLAAKQRARSDGDFPDKGLDGSEVQVLGYRGMREYVLAFEDFRIGSEGLLGGSQGAGFRQLMRTFESARIQTAARAVGVGRRALELGLAYALERRQFGRPLAGFPRIADKLALMTVETVIARELTYFAARSKDAGARCDVEAGMAKLLAARMAWSNADAALQIHGGNGYALEYEISRILCDARILNIFEGAAEIQATVVARGLLMRA